MNPLLRLLPLLMVTGALPARPVVIEVGPERAVTSLPAARALLRDLRTTDGLPQGATVRLDPGHYVLTETLVLGPDDAGLPGAPIRWSAAEPGTVILSGGRLVPAWAPLTDDAIRSRLPAAVQDQVVTIDLASAGITDLGQIAQRGNPGMELFHQGSRMPRAQFPNEGWLRIADVPQTGTQRFHEGLEREKRFDGVPIGRHYGRITYDGDRPRNWAPDEHITLHGYWTWDWSDSFQRIAHIDATTREITLAEPHHNYGYTRNQRYRFINVLEELDAPGEWYLDRPNQKIFFLPPAPLQPGDLTLSVLETPLVHLNGTAHVEFTGLTFEAGRGTGVLITGGQHCAVRGSTLRNLGGEAISIDGGWHHTVQSCDLHELANGAIRVAGGDRATLTNSGHRVANNHIHHFSQWLRTGQYGVRIDGVGNVIAHNLIHDAPFEAMYLRGNDHVIEYNEVHRVCIETGDAGAIHTGRDYTWQGNIIRYNYWHHLQGAGLHGVTAVYLDDFSSGFTIHGNVFYRAGRGVQLGGGRHNTVTNNLFIGSHPAVHLDARGLGWASYYFDGVYPWLFDRFAERGGDQPPYTDRYPLLATLLADEPAVPKGNVITGNVSWGGRWMDAYDFYAYDFHGVTTLRDNWIADPEFVRRRALKEDFWDPYYLNIDGAEGYRTWLTVEPETQEEFGDNHLTTEAPGTFDPATRTFTPHDPAALKALGFAPLPIDSMGLQIDAWRPTLQ